MFTLGTVQPHIFVRFNQSSVVVKVLCDRDVRILYASENCMVCCRHAKQNWYCSRCCNLATFCVPTSFWATSSWMSPRSGTNQVRIAVFYFCLLYFSYCFSVLFRDIIIFYFYLKLTACFAFKVVLVVFFYL